MKFLRNFTGLLIFSVLVSCSGQKDKFAKNWKATDVSLNGTAFKAEALGSFEFKYNADGSFEYLENGTPEKGTWTVSEDGKELTVKYSDREVKQKVVKQEGNALILDYSDHGMQRVVTLSAN